MKESDPWYIEKIALSLMAGVGPVTIRKLLACLGDPGRLFVAGKSRLERIPGIGPVTASAVADSDALRQAEEEARFVSKNKLEVLYFSDEDYPARLRHCDDNPIILFKKGNADLNPPKTLAIVGTRQATDPGRALCEKLLGDLAFAGIKPLIISGLAYGIDITAHRAALRNQMQTVGILAHGFSTLYPPAHRHSADEMIRQGGLLTEFASKAPFDRNNFLRRNRIIAGLADATVVVESGAKGGALVTAEMALAYNRDVFAFPGHPAEPLSEGCNQLIRTNVAALIRHAGDLIQSMAWEKPKSPGHHPQPKLFVELTDEEKLISEHLSVHGKLSIDQILHHTRLPMSRLNALLISMEFAGMVRSFPGKVFALV